MRQLPPVRIPHPHVTVHPDAEDGSPLVEGTRIPIRRIFSWHRQGTTCETLLRRYPHLGPARIFDALAFAYDNLDLITADLVREREAIAADQRAVDALRQYPQTPPPKGDRDDG